MELKFFIYVSLLKSFDFPVYSALELKQQLSMFACFLMDINVPFSVDVMLS